MPTISAQEQQEGAPHLMEIAPMSRNHKYVIITPIRDEEAFIEKTIQSVTSQTTLPAQWVIVNDGSTDLTGAIVDTYVARYPWIHVVHRENRGFRSAGGGVIEAFYAGYRALKEQDWNFIVKLDGDLFFDSDYFEKVFRYFEHSPDLGLGGGLIYNLVNGALLAEQHPVFHVRGATKIYKRECWDAIGGLLVAPGWDTLDEVKANMLGWKSRTFRDLKVTHYRYTGAADGQWRSCIKYGRANYISGYHPLFMALKCLRRVFHKPVLIGAFAIGYGYVSGYLKRVPQVDDRALITFLRKQQMNKILRRETMWE
ncbi:MAG: Glycosyltransferase family 2 protein [Nitrospira sp.]|nr:MAG: Glycosyltransferase family 2 protein [Nitrospira sp.]